MGILDKFKDLINSTGKSRLDVSARFTLERQAFSGTMSKFRVARDIKTNQRLGLKLLNEEKTRQFADRFKSFRYKKPREGEIGMAIHHPRVVETYEHGLTTSGQEYILMEYVHGPGLNSVIRERKEELKLVRLEFIKQMAAAVQAVHDAGFIHRDICPRNFICYHDLSWLKLIDFGLTLPNQPEYRMPGNRTGTPQYLAPEIVRRRSTDFRVDIFALGVSFYRMLTFEHPWGSTDTTGQGAVERTVRPHLDILELRPSLNSKLARMVNSCLALDPNERPESVERISKMIRDVADEEE